MTSKAALFALLAMWGVGSYVGAPVMAQEPTGEAQASETPLKRGFTNRVWVKTESDDLPGVMNIFMSDGTLVQDSCWETHRLSRWTMVDDTNLTWNEDGMDISAAIVSVTSRALHLQLKLGTETVDEHYVTATVPYVCPDMPRS